MWGIKADKKIFWFIKRSFLWFFKYLYLIFKIKNIKNIVLVPEKSIYKDKNLVASFMEDYLDWEILFLEIPTNHLSNWKNINHKYYLPLDFLFWLKLIYFYLYKFFNKNSYKDFQWAIDLLKSDVKNKFIYDILYKDASRKFSSLLMKTLFKNKKLFHIWDIIWFSFLNSSDVTEIQFWLFNKLRYTFPKNNNTKTFLDNEKLLIYQDYLIDELIKNWYKKENLVKIEKKPEIYTFLKYFSKKQNKNNKNKKVLIIEQPLTDRYELLDKVIDFLIKWDIIKNVEFGFKKHPNSYKSYDFLNEWNNKILFHWNKKHIYDTLTDYDYILTIDSTVIFEAKQFWLNIITIHDKNDKYIENVKNLLWDYKKYQHIDISFLKETLNNF